MNITWFTHYFVPEIGAPSARIYDLSRQWIAGGHAVSAVTCFPNHPTGRLYPGYRLQAHRTETIDGIRVLRTPTYIAPNRGFVKKLAGHVSLLPSAVVADRIGHVRSDVVIGTSPTFFAAMAAAAVAMRRRRPFIMEVRDLWPAIFVELGVLKNRHLIRMLEWLELALYRQAAGVVTVTDAFTQNLIARGVAADKVVTIPNGADTDYWQPTTDDGGLRRRLGLDGRFVALYIGAHGISHGLAAVLDAAAQLADARPDVVFVFVGTGAEKQRLMAAAAERRLANVRFHDPVDKAGVKSFYAMADVCLVPLRDIPLFSTFIPSKMFEIMAMGRPMVASLKGEAAGIAARSGGGLVVPPEDPRAMAAAVAGLHDDPGLCDRLGRSGRAFVCAEYARSLLAERYIAFIRQVVARYAGSRGGGW